MANLKFIFYIYNTVLYFFYLIQLFLNFYYKKAKKILN